MRSVGASETERIDHGAHLSDYSGDFNEQSKKLCTNTYGFYGVSSLHVALKARARGKGKAEYKLSDK